MMLLHVLMSLSFIIVIIYELQVSSVTEHVGGQDAGTNAADFDDDDGGGLVS